MCDRRNIEKKEEVRGQNLVVRQKCRWRWVTYSGLCERTDFGQINMILTIYGIHPQQMFKIDRCLFPDQFSSIFILSSKIHDHNTKAKYNIHIHSHPTKVKAHSISIYGAKVWTAIPVSITRSK